MERKPHQIRLQTPPEGQTPLTLRQMVVANPNTRGPHFLSLHINKISQGLEIGKYCHEIVHVDMWCKSDGYWIKKSKALALHTSLQCTQCWQLHWIDSNRIKYIQQSRISSLVHVIAVLPCTKGCTFVQPSHTPSFQKDPAGLDYSTKAVPFWICERRGIQYLRSQIECQVMISSRAGAGSLTTQ